MKTECSPPFFEMFAKTFFIFWSIQRNNYNNNKIPTYSGFRFYRAHGGTYLTARGSPVTGYRSPMHYLLDHKNHQQKKPTEIQTAHRAHGGTCLTASGSPVTGYRSPIRYLLDHKNHQQKKPPEIQTAHRAHGGTRTPTP